MDIRLEIDNQKVLAGGDLTIMEAANKLGIYIPHFCYHPKLSVAANCRMCLVEVEKSPKPIPACATPVSDGMVVRTQSVAARRAQHGVMEFLLINHPLDCPICDQGGECQLQDLAVGYGVSSSRYQEEKRVVFEKNLGPLISTDMTRCIHCTRCVRFGREVAGVMELGMSGRGEHVEIMPFVERTVDSELSGNMIDICPVGALTSKPFRFSARPWELSNKDGVAAHDSWGSNLCLQIKDDALKRVLPKDNEAINQCWISDRDRFSYLGLRAKDRAVHPQLRMVGGTKLPAAGWQDAVDVFVQKIKTVIGKHGAQKVGFFCSPNSTAEELHLLQKIARSLGAQMDCRLRQRDFSCGSVHGFGATTDAIAVAKHILFIGANPPSELPLLAARLRRRKRCKISAIGALDFGEKIPLTKNIVRRPAMWGDLLAQLVHLLGGGKSGQEMLFANSDEQPLLKSLAETMQKAGRDNLVLLGGGAQTSENYGQLIRYAKKAARLLNCRVGVLSDGCNGLGAQKVGAHINETAAMLRSDLKAAILFGCEPADFVEREMLTRVLRRADFVGAVVTHTGGVAAFADCVLPLAAFAETGGAFINGGGAVQTFAAAARPPAEARPGWKILRVLGEKFNVDGFEFSDLSEVWAQIADKLSPDIKDDSSPADNLDSSADAKKDGSSDDSLFDLAGGVPIYDGDMLVRRAESLQKTNAARASLRAFMNGDDMKALSIVDGEKINIGDGQQRWQGEVFSDNGVARGTILAFPPNLTAARGLSLTTAEKVAV